MLNSVTRTTTASTMNMTTTTFATMSELLSAFEPSQPTKDYLRVEKKLQFISMLFIPQVSFSQTTNSVLFTISERKPRKKKKTKKTKQMFWSLFIFRGHSRREPASSRVTCFILRAYEAMANTGKNSGDVLRKMQVNGPEE